jgi:hypothetical protein
MAGKVMLSSTSRRQPANNTTGDSVDRVAGLAKDIVDKETVGRRSKRRRLHHTHHADRANNITGDSEQAGLAGPSESENNIELIKLLLNKIQEMVGRKSKRHHACHADRANNITGDSEQTGFVEPSNTTSKRRRPASEIDPEIDPEISQEKSKRRHRSKQVVEANC